MLRIWPPMKKIIPTPLVVVVLRYGLVCVRVKVFLFLVFDPEHLLN